MKKIIVLCLLAIVVLSCGKDYYLLEAIHNKTLLIHFVNADGDSLVLKNKLDCDTLDSGTPDYNIYLSSEEYKLDFFLNGESMDRVCKYLNVYDGRLSFEAWIDLEKKKDYVYKYHFTCPKLFGDDAVHVLQVNAPWDGRYHPLKEVYLDGEEVANGQGFITIVL